MKKFSIKNSFETSLLNEPKAEEYFFVDLEKKEVVLLDSCTSETESLIRLPYQEDLYPYGAALNDYLNQYDLFIPTGMRPKEYLAEQELLDDFLYGFWPKETSKRLSLWLSENFLNIKTIA